MNSKYTMNDCADLNEGASLHADTASSEPSALCSSRLDRLFPVVCEEPYFIVRGDEL